MSMCITQPYIQCVGLMIFIAVLLITGVQGKDERCRQPVTENCNASESYIDGWKFTGWYYHEELRVCRPLYTPNGWHTCPENYELPEAREMCEDLCADTCYRTNGMLGVCMSNEICRFSNDKKPPALYPCGDYSLNCCAKASDNELKSFPGLVFDKGGIVFRAVRKNLSDPGYGYEEFTYIYYLPYYINDKGKRYN